MANYNADIRVGITGKTQLNALERQLGRINKDLNQINKNLKAQTLTINTKGATRALDQLDRKINKLNRSINVNANINERRRGGDSATVISGGGSSKALATGLAAAATQNKILNAEVQKFEATIEKVNNLEQEILDKTKELQEVYRRQDQVRKGFAEKGKSLKQSESQLANSARMREAAQERRVQAFEEELRLLQQQSAEQRKLQRIEDERTKGLSFDERLRRLREKNKNIGKFRRGLGTGAGLGASSALSGVPVLGDAVTGGLVGGLSGGSIAGGAIGGAFAGGLVALAEFGAQAVKTATQVNKLRLSLELAAGTDFERSLETISTVVDDFNTPIEDATTNFTKLYASAQGSGIAFEDLSELFINLSAANKAFAGDAESLNGILRAFTQIISKGTVQSEELKGQVGERLPGAFALAAQSLGMTTAELQKALENGEVKSKEFVEKFGRYMRRFREDAQTIADAPEEAGARLTVALQNLQVDTGQELARLGAQFQNFVTEAIEQLTRLYNFLGQLGDDLENRLNRLGGNPTADLDGYVKGLQNANDAISQIQTRLLDSNLTLTPEQIKDEEKNLEIWYQSRKDFQAKIDKLKLGPPVPNTSPTSTGATKDEDDPLKPGSGPRDRTAELRAELALEQALLEIQRQRSGLRGVEGQLAEFELQKKEIQKELENELKQIKTENITADSKAYAVQVAQTRAARELEEINEAQQIYKEDQLKAFKDQLADLETEIAIEEAVTEE